MYALGDIVLVEEFSNKAGRKVGLHPFLIVDGREGSIYKHHYDFIGVMLSSKKSGKIDKYKTHIGIEKSEGVKLDSYIKLEDMYCMSKERVRSYKVGHVDIQKILEIMEELKKYLSEGYVKHILTNTDDQEFEKERTLQEKLAKYLTDFSEEFEHYEVADNKGIENDPYNNLFEELNSKGMCEAIIEYLSEFDEDVSEKRSLLLKMMEQFMVEKFTRVSLTEMLEVIEFEYEYDEEGQIKLIDQTGTNLGNIMDESFDTPADVIDRLELYYYDYLFREYVEDPRNEVEDSMTYEDVYNQMLNDAETRNKLDQNIFFGFFNEEKIIDDKKLEKTKEKGIER